MLNLSITLKKYFKKIFNLTPVIRFLNLYFIATLKFTILYFKQVYLIELEMFLRTAKAPTSGLLEGWLDDNLWIITSVLKSKKIVVSAKDSNGQDIELDVPVLKDAVGGKLTVGRSASSSTDIVFEGDTPLPFAAQLFKVRKYKGDNPPSMTLRETKAGGVVVKSMTSLTVEDMQSTDDVPLILPDILENGLGGQDM